MEELNKITAALQAAKVPFVGVAILKPDREIEEHWHVYDTPKGLKVRIDWEDEPSQKDEDAAMKVLKGLKL